MRDNKKVKKKWKREPLSDIQKKDYYNGYITLTIPVKVDKGNNPIPEIEPINDQIESIIDSHYLKSNFKYIRTHFSLQIGYNFGTEDSESMLDHSVNVWDIGYKPLSFYIDEYAHLIPYDMAEYEGIFMYAAIDIRNPKEPIESVFQRF